MTTAFSFFWMNYPCNHNYVSSSCRKTNEFLQRIERSSSTVPMALSNAIPASPWVRQRPKMHCMLHRPEFKPLVHNCGTEVREWGTGIIHTNWSVFDACFQCKQSSLRSFHWHGTLDCSKESACWTPPPPLNMQLPFHGQSSQWCKCCFWMVRQAEFRGLPRVHIEHASQKEEMDLWELNKKRDWWCGITCIVWMKVPGKEPESQRTKAIWQDALEVLIIANHNDFTWILSSFVLHQYDLV